MRLTKVFLLKDRKPTDKKNKSAKNISMLQLIYVFLYSTVLGIHQAMANPYKESKRERTISALFQSR